MRSAGLWSGALALLLLLPHPVFAQQVMEIAPAQSFAPPLARPMTYRVTTRRVSRSGTLISFSLVYALQWQAAGRGYRLDATLWRIESDARPELVRGLTGLFQPLIGETVSYLVDHGGRNIALADPSQTWARVAQRTQDLAAAAEAPEAKQVAALLANLPEAEREKMITADIRALVAPANVAIPAMEGAHVSIRLEGAKRIVTATERTDGGAATPLAVDMVWMIDTSSGLVLSEQRQSWITEPGTDARTLVEERIRALIDGSPA